PYAVQVAADQREARLITMAGDTLWQWRIDEPGWFSLAKLVERPAEFGGAGVVILATANDPDLDGAGHILAYDPQGSRTTPLWSWSLNRDL
ncbi:MAG: hypothetical protein ACRDTI_09055, partial [Mycobacterium sp.]